jgi:membrane protein DedA with SNARE-associated domain
MSIVTTAGLLAFLQTQGYFIMLIIMIVEGAIVTYVASFIASMGIFNIYIVLGLSILGNILGDIILYFVGRHWGRKVLLKHFYSKLKGKKLHKLEDLIKKHPGRSVALVKISPFIPIPGLILIGASEVPIKKFLFFSLITSFVYSLIFTLLGFYSGVAFNALARYVDNSSIIIGVAVVLGIGAWYLIRYISSKITKRKGLD